MTDARKPLPKIAIAGAGSIGCYVGGCLGLAGREVSLLARPRVVEAAQNSFRITDFEGRDRNITMAASDNPQTVLADAGLVLVTVKSGQTREMAALIARHAPPAAIVVSLQNGTENAARITGTLNGVGQLALPGMVAFNVVQSGEANLRFHRATAGEVIVQSGHSVGAILDVEGLPTREADDMAAILWGKLLLNLNNALNALSGLPLAQQLARRDWRRIFASEMDEALAAMTKAGIRPAKLASVPPRFLPHILRMPDWLFARLARKMLAIDPEARSSMWEDLQRGRLTEIDELQGAIERLGSAHGVPTPLNNRVTQLIRAAEQAKQGSPGLTARDVTS